MMAAGAIGANNPGYEYGVLLPHFGRNASRKRLIDGARQIEQYGFDSVWVRDHIVFHPHAHEDQNKTHVDPFVVLSAVAGATDRIKLATGTLIPHRHPILAALMIGSLDFVAGPGRLIIGWGTGTYDHEFAAIGMAGWDRREVIEEQIKIVRKLWAGGSVDHDGKYYQFEGVEIQPVPGGPEGRSVPIWYGGTSLAAVRRAVEYCDGWIPSRMPKSVFTKCMQRMERLAGEAGKPVPDAGTIPLVVPGRTVKDALRWVNEERLLEEVNASYAKGNGAAFTSANDLDGAVILGPADRIGEEVRAWQAVGGRHFVFDLRPSFDEWEEGLATIGEEVLPELLRGDGRAIAPEAAAVR